MTVTPRRPGHQDHPDQHRPPRPADRDPFGHQGDHPQGGHVVDGLDDDRDQEGQARLLQDRRRSGTMRVTWTGEYLHSAPWSVGAQGSANVSHGCVNMSPANAAVDVRQLQGRRHREVHRFVPPVPARPRASVSGSTPSPAGRRRAPSSDPVRSTSAPRSRGGPRDEQEGPVAGAVPSWARWCWVPAPTRRRVTAWGLVVRPARPHRATAAIGGSCRDRSRDRSVDACRLDPCRLANAYRAAARDAGHQAAGVRGGEPLAGADEGAACPTPIGLAKTLRLRHALLRPSGHPSLPNYLAIASGRTHGVTDDARARRRTALRGPSVFGRALASRPDRGGVCRRDAAVVRT